MDLSHLPIDHFAKADQFTRILYNDLYPSITPSSEELSQKGKIVLVTGASSGIGRYGIALSFAKAGASVLILAGRNRQDLQAAATEIQLVAPAILIDIRAVDISSEAEVRDTFNDLKSKYPRIDILVNNAGTGGTSLPIVEIDAGKWWHNFEVNVKGTFLITQNFLRLNGKDSNVTIINVTSAAALNSFPSLSSYSLSKLCQIRLQDFVRAENPSVQTFSLHPGIVMTRMTPPFFKRFSRDTFDLVGGVTVWLASKQAGFMNGRYMSVNWSVDELIERKDEIVSNGLLEVKLQGIFGDSGRFDS
ncbi:Short chain dehydrogenase andI [Talaromyces pinophilus]|nr:Short chain dehydrogenase andI [Talaromyces pinophilus]